MISLGLDPSLTGFGWAIHDSSAQGISRVVAKGQFKTKANELFVTRYMFLRDSVITLLRNNPQVQVVGVESTAFGEYWSEGAYGLFLYVNEAVYTCRKDVVFFDPNTLKFLAKGRKREGKMYKSDMIAAARADTDGAKIKWNHNEADGYLVAKFTARLWCHIHEGLPSESLTEAETHVFRRTHTYVRGKHAGETTQEGMIFREGERFFRYSNLLGQPMSKKEAISAQSKVAQDAIQFIQKATGQKPIGAHTDTFPHISTGSGVINTLIGGSPMPDGKGFVCPGLPFSRIVEIYGAESSGKTTAAVQFMVSVQKLGGVAMFLDFENALQHNYAKACGLDFSPEKLLYYTPDNLEEGMKMIFIAIRSGVKLIVVDSVSAMVPQSELEKKIGDPAKIGALAAAMSTYLPKVVQWLKGRDCTLVLINQIRSLISASARGDTDNTSGGKAVKFYASVRLKLTRIKSEIVEKVDPLTLKKKRTPYGNLVVVKVVKNKMDSKQGATGEIFIRYGSGIDEYMTVIEGAVPRKIINKDGSGYTYGTTKMKGREQFRKFLVENPKVYLEIQNKITAALLAAAPEALAPDEIDDDDIMADLSKEMGDDQIFDSEGDEGAAEDVVEEDALDAHRGL